MASITSLTNSSSTSSLYGNRNIISGLASGMDTESMIENAVSGLKERIAGLNQDREMLEWEQSAYRSIIDKLSSFSEKYLSYTSSTNLLSAAFFDNSTNVTASGTYANLISATGNPTSTVQILSVSKLATAASASCYLGGVGDKPAGSFTSDALDLGGEVKSSTVTGSMTLSIGDSKVTLDFDDTVYETTGNFADAINEKLKGTDLEGYVTAQATADGISFTTTDGSALKITAASGSLKETLGIEPGDGNIAGTSFAVTDEDLSTSKTVLENMIGKNFTFTMDGVTKTITLDETDKQAFYDGNGDLINDPVGKLAEILQGKVTDAFGEGKVTVTATADGALTFNTVKEGSTLKITGAEELGLSSSATSYVNTGKKLSELGFAAGTDGYSFTMNGKTLTFDADATLADVISAVNNDEDIGVKVSFSELTNKFQLTSKETGANSRIETGDDLAKALFGEITASGEDAELSVKINGDTVNMTRSSNSIEIDGMTVKLNGTFAVAEGEEAVSFSAAADADKIVNALKSMIADYNTMANEIKDAYSTQPLRDSSGDRYEPLTAEDAEDMSESAIEKYEKKAKTGILFGDSDLSNLYNELRSAISSLDLEAIGISTEYESGKTTLKLDETKLRSVLENDPNKVRDTLTKSTVTGATTDGALTRIQDTIEKYAKTTGTKGILVKLAGSEKSAVSLIDNDYKDKMDRLDEQIARWQEKLSNKIDYYTRQFSALEQLIAKMNSQSSALSGMMGY